MTQSAGLPWKVVNPNTAVFVNRATGLGTRSLPQTREVIVKIVDFEVPPGGTHEGVWHVWRLSTPPAGIAQ